MAAKATNLKNNPSFYRDIGRLGGIKGRADGVVKGFALMTYEQRAAAGAKGGAISRKSKNAN